MFIALITFVIILSILVLVHEFGHFLLAKKVGIKVEEFGLGLPPRAVGKKAGGTIYSLNWLPFGGFVRLKGEELAGSYRALKDKASFWGKSKFERALVIIAGVIFNFLLAVVAFSIVYSFTGIPRRTNQVIIEDIIAESPAEKVGLKINDTVAEVDSNKISSLDQFTRVIDQKKGQTIVMKVNRQGASVVFNIIPRANPPENQGPLGVLVSDVQMVKYPLWQMPFWGTIEGTKEAFAWIGIILAGLGKMVSDLFAHGTVPRDVAGPVGIFQITGAVAQQGILSIIQLLGILSVNLAVVNILPIPALDGGRLAFIAYEVVSGKRPKPSFEQKANAVGMAFLLFLIFLVTINDLVRIFGSLDLTSLINKIAPF